MADDFTPEELASLTEEERAALADEDGNAGGTAPAEQADAAVSPEAAAAEQKAPEGEVVPEPNKGDQPPAGEAPPTNPAEMAADAPPVNEQPAKEPVKPIAGHDPFAPKLTGPQMSDEQYKAARADLKAKFDAGDMDIHDYTDAMTDLKLQRGLADFTDQNNNQTNSQKWEYAQDYFLSMPENTEYRENPALFGALDATIRSMASDPETANMSDIQFLMAAKTQVEKMLGRRAPDQAAPAAAPAPVDTPPERKPALERTNIPPAMGGLPQEASGQPVDEFADLNNLTGAELEAAIAKMPPERQEKWLKAS